MHLEDTKNCVLYPAQYVLDLAGSHLHAETWYRQHILALRLLLLYVVVQIMIMLLLWQLYLNITLLPNITTWPSNTASVCAGTFGVRRTAVLYYKEVVL